MNDNERVLVGGLTYDSIDSLMDRLVCRDWEAANDLDSERKWSSLADQLLGESLAMIWVCDISEDDVVRQLVHDLQFCTAIAVQRAYDATVRGSYA